MPIINYHGRKFINKPLLYTYSTHSKMPYLDFPLLIYDDDKGRSDRERGKERATGEDREKVDASVKFLFLPP